MRKNLLLTTAIVAASLCFGGMAYAVPDANSDKGVDNYLVNHTVEAGINDVDVGNTAVPHKTLISNKDTEHNVMGESYVSNVTITVNSELEFTNNNTDARVGGVFGNWWGENLVISDGVKFEENSAESGGAIHSEGSLKYAGENRDPAKVHSTFTVGNSVQFKNNEATDDEGGAISIIGNQTAAFGNSVLFEGNIAASRGGALNIQTDAGEDAYGVYDEGSVSVTFGSNAKFKGNSATDNGGAIAHYVFDSAEHVSAGSSVTFGENATFEGNTSFRGGAIINYAGSGINKAVMTFGNGALFKDNIATHANAEKVPTGGAIDNRATINFGNVTFSGNKVRETLNDIYNTGIVNFNGDTTLDGGITGNGTVNFAAGKTLTASANGTTFDANTVTFAGNNTIKNVINSTGTVAFNGDVTLDKGITGTSAITFASGTTLNATLDKTTIEASSVTFAGDNKLNLTVANGMAGDDYDFIDAATLTGEENVTIADNAIYNLTLTDEGKINVAVKSAHEIVENIDVPVAKQEAETLTAIISSNGNGTGVGNSIADAISAAMQSGNSAAAVQAVKDLAPTTSQQVMGVAQGVNNMLSNVTGGRMAAVSGRSGGDMFKGGSAWAQGLYNRTKQNTTADGAGFKADSAGFAMGIDGKVNDDLTIGFGYGFTRTDADSTGRTVDVDGHNFFVYGSYQPNAWYVDTMLSYGIGKYTEKKAPMGVAMTAKYDVNTFAANIMSGYGFNNGITPEGGIRYIYADQEAYNDGAQRISTDGSDVLTAVMGVKYEKDISVSNYKVKPSLRLVATYDLVSDNSKANINVIGGGSYEIVGKRLNRLGGEVGAGITGTFGKWDLSLEYNGGFRQNYQSHTGLIKAQYNF